MNYETTSLILKELEPYIVNSQIKISSKNENYFHSKCKSDYIMIDSANNVGFEVFDNEIIVFYFTMHIHFEDYSFEPDDDKDNNYIKRAELFLKELFEYTIQHIEYYKGKKLISEKYFLKYDNANNNECIGNSYYGLFRIINPLKKKTMRLTLWRFDKENGIFREITDENN